MCRLPFTLILFSLCLSCQTQTLVENMTGEQWIADLNFLEKKLETSMAVLETANRQEILTEIVSLRANLNELAHIEIMARMCEIVAAVGDGHTELNLMQMAAGFRRIPISFHFFDKKLYVLAGAPDYVDLLGKEVASINGVPVATALEKMKKLLAHDNDQEFYYAAPALFSAPQLLDYLGITQDAQSVTLEMQGGLSMEIQALDLADLDAVDWKNALEVLNIEPPLYAANPGRRYWHKFLADDGIFYFQLNRVHDQKGEISLKKYLRQMFDEVDDVRPEKLVVDVRFNNGGNYHKSKPLVKAIQERPWLNQQGKLYVINGKRTFSAAMVASIFLRRDCHGILIGENSRSRPNGSDNNEYAQLPNSGLNLSYTTKTATHWKKKGDADVLEVDIPIAMRIEDYMAGRDPVLEFIKQAE